LNNVQFNREALKMQMLLAEKLALTFVDDAYAFASGFGKILVQLVTAPIQRMVQAVMAPVERIARACDVAGVLSDRRAKANFARFHARRHAPTSSRRASSRRCLFPFRSLNDLT
jgi:hypothetical protein